MPRNRQNGEGGAKLRPPQSSSAILPHSGVSHCIQTQSGYFFGLNESFRDTERLNTSAPGALSTLSTQK